MFLEISQNSQEITSAGITFLHPFVKIESLTQVFSFEFCEHLSKKPFFYRTPQVSASEKACNFTKIRLRHEFSFCEFSERFFDALQEFSKNSQNYW